MKLRLALPDQQLGARCGDGGGAAGAACFRRLLLLHDRRARSMVSASRSLSTGFSR